MNTNSERDVDRHDHGARSDAWFKHTSAEPPRNVADDPASLGTAIDHAFDWLRRQGWLVLVAATFFQAGVLLSLSYQGASPAYAAGARTVLLQVYPIDPRDLMRGDYVTLGYDFSRSSVPFKQGGPIYVPLTLEADGRHARGQWVQNELPKPGTLFLRGTTEGNGLAHFGIEKFFVPEGQGKPYEDAARQRQLWAEVTIAPDGEPRLQRLVIE